MLSLTGMDYPAIPKLWSGNILIVDITNVRVGFGLVKISENVSDTRGITTNIRAIITFLHLGAIFGNNISCYHKVGFHSQFLVVHDLGCVLPKELGMSFREIDASSMTSVQAEVE